MYLVEFEDVLAELAQRKGEPSLEVRQEDDVLVFLRTWIVMPGRGNAGVNPGRKLVALVKAVDVRLDDV